jgi:excisionase family DNA binding protein
MNNSNESLLSKKTVMEMLKCSEKTLRRLIREGRLRVVKFGKTSPLRFRQIDVARFLESSVVTGAASFN